MEEEISRMKTFLKDFNNDQIQSPTSDEITYTRVGNYGLDPEDVTGQVIDWILNYLDNRKCPYSLALAIAKEAAQQVNASFTTLSQGAADNDDKSCNSAAIYAEAINKLPTICNSFLNQTNLQPSCSLKYATSVFAIKNKRRKMEDRYVIHHDLNTVLDLKDMPHHSYYAVFDGHSGRDAACYASAQLHVNIAKHPDFVTDTPKAIIEGYQITDLNFLNKCNRWSNIKSGCTAVSALIRENTVYLSWLGDSQAVLVKHGAPAMITNPHKPDREDEKQRIESLGGHVSHVGTWRVNGLLAVTRALGDPDQKRFISSEPELSILNLDGTEDFLILACDGLWDGMSPEDVTGVMYRYLEDCSPNEPLDAFAAKLVHQSKLQGSDDNITAIVIFLRDIKTIKENSAKFMSSSYCVQDHDFMSMNGSMKTLDLENSNETHFSKPTVLELNAASSKKLKNAANVMSSAGFGGSYTYQYGENTSESVFQNLESSVMDTAQGVFHRPNVTASCFAPEATALSELPTPPIDDMLASQQSENFYSTDLYKEFSNLQTVESSNPAESNPVTGETLQSPIQESVTKTVSSTTDNLNNKSLLNPDNMSNANSEAITPDEAVGVASTVVSTAIETAVKCLSSSETVDSAPSLSPVKLNPYAKPFVMKSFFNPGESELETGVASNEACDISVTSNEKVSKELSSPLVTDNITDATHNVEFEQFAGDRISDPSTESSTVDCSIPNQSAVDLVDFKHSQLGTKLTSEEDSHLATLSNPLTQSINQTTEKCMNDSFKSDIKSNSSPSEILTDVLNSNITQTCSADIEPDTSVKENLIKIEDQETVQLDKNISIPDFANTSLGAVGESTLNVCKKIDFSNISPDSYIHPKSPKLDLVDTTEQSSTYSELPKQDQIINSTKMVVDVTTENNPIIIENKSKQNSDEKSIIDITENCLLESSPLIDQQSTAENTLLDLTPVEILPKFPTQESQKELNASASSVLSSLPSDNQNSNSDLTSKNLLLCNSDKESKCVAIEKHTVDTVERNVSETSHLIDSLPIEPISLMDIKNELIPAEVEVPSDPSVEAVAVDLKSLPVGIPEAEGVTEDVDSDSEKDGGWSYMKGNTVSGSKSKPVSKTSGSVKSNVTTKGKRDITKPNLDLKSKVKSATVDKTKTNVADKMKSTTDKTKSVVADKPKNFSTVDKTKTLSSVDKTKKAVAEKKPDVKTRTTKPSTVFAATRVTSDKTSRITSSKKETETTKPTSTAPKPLRPTTLVRVNAPTTSKPVSAISADRNTLSSKLTAKPKMGLTGTETKSAVKTTTSTLSKGQTVSQTKTTATRNTTTRPVTTVPNKTSTIIKSSVQKSVASETKPKQLASTAANTLKKPPINTIKKSEVKEVKDSVNKQIVAKKNTATSKVDSSSTLMSKRVASASTKSTVTRVASSSTKLAVSKRDVPKSPGIKSAPKNVGVKVSQESSSNSKGGGKNVESVQTKTEEAKNTLNTESDQKNIETCSEIAQVAEKFTLETSDKEMIVKEKCEVSCEEKNVEGSLTNPITPSEDKTPNLEPENV